MIYFRFGGFCVYIDQIKLARFGRGKRGIFINFQNGDFFKGRLFTIVIFIRGKNKLLILFEIKYLPGAGAEYAWAGTIPISVRLYGKVDQGFFRWNTTV